MKPENNASPTPEQIEGYCQKLITEMKQSPTWELEQEFGRLLMRRIDSFSEQERERYEELKKLLDQPT